MIFLSALIETEDKVKAFSAGAADYVSKPFQFDEIRARVETHLGIRRLQLQIERHNRELEALVAEQVKEIADSQMATIFALAKLAESRDDETGRHLEHVQELCRLLAMRMREQGGHDGLDDIFIANVVHAAPLHDIGKVAIPDRILLKPSSLTAEEFEIMKTHTTLGAQTLEAVRHEYSHNAFIDMGVQIARSHHERWDGSGYPDGLAGEESRCARGSWRWWMCTTPRDRGASTSRRNPTKRCAASFLPAGARSSARMPLPRSPTCSATSRASGARWTSECSTSARLAPPRQSTPT